MYFGKEVYYGRRMYAQLLDLLGELCLERKKQLAEKRKLLNRYAKVEELIDLNEKKLAELEENYYAPEIASDYEKLSKISSQIDSLRLEIDNLMEEWEALQLQIDEDENC